MIIITVFLQLIIEIEIELINNKIKRGLLALQLFHKENKESSQ